MTYPNRRNVGLSINIILLLFFIGLKYPLRNLELRVLMEIIRTPSLLFRSRESNYLFGIAKSNKVNKSNPIIKVPI